MSLDEIIKDIVESPPNGSLKCLSDMELSEHVRRTYRTLDGLDDDFALATALGCNHNRRSIAQAVVERGYLSPVLPDGHPISRRGHLSRYLSSDIVGEAQVDENLKRYLSETYSDLDQMDTNKALSSVLGCDFNTRSIVREVVRHGLMSPMMPGSHPIGDKGACLSWYVCPDVIGEEQAARNLRQYICDTYSNLDEIDVNRALSTALGCGGKIRSITRAVVERGFLSSTMPDGHPISKGMNLSWYVCADVVGKETAFENLRSYVLRTYPDLDEIDCNKALSRILDCELNEQSITRMVVRLGLMSGILPDGHPITKQGSESKYICPDVVGAGQARQNIRKHVQANYGSLADIKLRNYGLSSALELSDSKVSTLRIKIAALGWLKQGLVEYSPKERNDYSGLKTVEDALRYREEFFPGMARTEIAHDHDNGGCGFYQFISRKGWRDAVLPHRRDGKR